MKVPSQVEEAAQLAEELHEKMYSTQQDPQEDTVEEEQETQEETQPEEEEEVEQEPEIDYKTEFEKAEQRYKTLQGMFNKEKKDWQSQLDEFKQSVFERLNQPTNLQQQVNQPKEDKFAKFKEEYGEELFDTIYQVSKQIASEELSSVIKPVQEHVASVEDTQIQAARSNFVNYLDSKVKGNWQQEWNGLLEGSNVKFAEFLNQPDPSGLYTYGDLVKLYNDNWDGDKMATIFNNYFDSQGTQTQRPPARNPQKEAVIAPSRQTAHNSPSTTDAKIWTQAEIQQFQRDDRANKYSPEQSKALWDDMLSAMSQGRIRP